jgi:hypothetical protein
MKHFFTLVALAFAVNAAWAQSNLPNGDLENWHNVVVNATLNYDELGVDASDNWMGTLNSLVAVPPTAGGPGPQTIYKTDDKYSGTWAAKAISKNFPLGPSTIFIPGMIGTAVMNMTGVTAILGKPCADCKPIRFKGYYKYDPINGDSCAAVILLSRWNSSAHKRDTVGYGKFVQTERVTTYTPFDVPVTYSGSGSIDTMTVLVVASAGFNVINFLGSVGQEGNTMYVDELKLEYAAGIEQSLMPEVSVNAYPNPTAGRLTIELSRELKNGVFEIYSTDGKMVGSFQAAGLKNTIPVSHLVNGIYHYRLMDGKGLMNTGTFVMKK